MYKLLDDENPSIRLRASQTVIEFSLRIPERDKDRVEETHDSELEKMGVYDIKSAHAKLEELRKIRGE